MKKAAQKEAQTTIHVVKAATCPSLSGKSKLTYHVGCTPESKVLFRLVANSAPGYFNDDWVPFEAIQQAFAKAPEGEPITSFVLHPIYRGQSQNSPAFLFAALKQEGLVRPAKDKPRSYDRVDPKGFTAEVKALIAGAPKGKGQAQQAEEKSGQTATDKKAPTKTSAKKK